jgi:hypothetical protein
MSFSAKITEYKTKISKIEDRYTLAECNKIFLDEGRFIEKSNADCKANSEAIQALIAATEKWYTSETTKVENQKKKMEELKTKMEPKIKELTDKKCTKFYTCVIAKDKYSSEGERKECIAVSNSIEPSISCYYEELPKDVTENKDGK